MIDYLLLAQGFDWKPLAIGAGLVFAGIIGLILVFAFAKYGNLWIQAFSSGANIGIFDLIGMHLRKVKPEQIVTAKIMATQAGMNVKGKDGITNSKLEAHYLAGGRSGGVLRVITAIIAAQRAGIDLDYDRAVAIDLAGRDILKAVTTSVDPIVIDCPDAQKSGKNFLSAISKDGIELKVRARVTVRTNLEQLIGGATEDTVIARVGESIISSIGSSGTHQDVLENPDRISKNVLE